MIGRRTGDDRVKVLMILSKEIITDDRVYREAKALVDGGYQVTVIVWDRHGDYPLKEDIDGIEVARLRNKRLMKILPNDIFRNPLWWRMAYRKGLELYKNGFVFDVVHCHDLDTLQTGVWLKKKLGVKLVYDAHEIFGYMIENNVPKFIVKSSFRMESKLLKHVDHLITINKPLENYFKSLIKKPITVVMNCKDLIIKEYRPPKNNVFTICYFGLLNENSMFPHIVDIIGNIENVRFVIAGKKGNPLYDEIKAISEKYTNVEFLGTLPSTKVLPKILECDAVLAIVNPSILLNQMGISNKIFEAMAAGRPMITTSSTYRGEFVEKEKAGLIVEYNEEAMQKAIIQLRDNPELREKLGKNGFRATKEKYNWPVEKEKLLKVYISLNK